MCQFYYSRSVWYALYMCLQKAGKVRRTTTKKKEEREEEKNLPAAAVYDQRDAEINYLKDQVAQLLESQRQLVAASAAPVPPITATVES